MLLLLAGNHRWFRSRGRKRRTAQRHGDPGRPRFRAEPGDAFVEADGFTGGFEHRAALDAVNDFRRVRAEAEVDYFHQLTLLAWCTKRFVSIRANAVPVLHRQGDSPTTARKWGLTKNVPD